MAAKSTDSNLIFEAYLQRGVILERGQGAVQRRLQAQGPQEVEPTGPRNTGGRGSLVQRQSLQAYRDSNPNYVADAQAAQGQAAAATQAGVSSPESSEPSQSSSSLNSNPDLNLQTTRPGEAVAAGTGTETGLGSVARTSAEQGSSSSPAPLTTPGSTPSTSSGSSQVAATGTPSTEEKELFKKLHGSDYSPGVGDQRLAELRTAVQQAGGTTDINKIASAAYAQQYAGTPQGQAYAKKAEALGVRVPRPGEVAPSSTNYAQQDQQLGLSPETQQDLAASQQQQSAPIAQANRNSPEYQRWYDEGRRAGFVS